MSFSIGTDIGGTFTDLTLSQDGVLVGRFKASTTPDDLAAGVLECIGLAAEHLDLIIETLLSDTEVFVHGSTIATNAVLEGKVAHCGVICTKGTKYTLWRGEGRRSDIFDFTQPPREPLVPPERCVEISERMDRNGHVLVPLGDEEVIEVIDTLRTMGCTAVAVCLLWAIRNPEHEDRIGRLLAEHWPEAIISLSSDVQPVIREYTRMSCTVLNSMLKPVVVEYLDSLRSMLERRGLRGELLVVASDGGVQPVEEITQRPVYMLFSGPSTGPAAARSFAQAESSEDCLLIDMGGTSFDVSTVIEGRVTVTGDGRISGYPTGLAAVEILTLGAGGGSIASVDRGGLLRVGPESAGAEPGPACYGRGGTAPTVTDAYLTLGYLAEEHFLGGRMALSKDAAEQAIGQHVADPLNLSIEQAALGILSVVNERMINGILEMTVRRGIDPRGLVLVTAGGATGVAAIDLATELGIRKIIVPRETSVLCAYGALNADLKWSNVVSCPTSSKQFDQPAVNGSVQRLASDGKAFLDRLGVSDERRRFDLYAAARYPLQVTELDVNCPGIPVASNDVETITETFHKIYKERYAVSEPDNDVEFVMWRVVASGLTAPTQRTRANEGSSKDSGAVIGETRFYDKQAKTFVEVPMLDPDRMQPGDAQQGPALLVATDTTVVLPAGATAVASRGGYLTIELNG